MFGYDVDCGGEFDTAEEAAEAWNRRTGKDINVPTNAERMMKHDN